MAREEIEVNVTKEQLELLKNSDTVEKIIAITDDIVDINPNDIKIGYKDKYESQLFKGNIGIGHNSTRNGDNSIAIGNNSQTNENSIALGHNAKCNVFNTIQIGTGFNQNEGTVQIKDTTILNADGKIPTKSINGTDGVGNKYLKDNGEWGEQGNITAYKSFGFNAFENENVELNIDVNTPPYYQLDEKAKSYVSELVYIGEENEDTEIVAYSYYNNSKTNNILIFNKDMRPQVVGISISGTPVKDDIYKWTTTIKQGGFYVILNSVEGYTGEIKIKTSVKDAIDSKQDKLTAGQNIEIKGDIISAIGGGVDLSDYVKNTDYATATKGGVVKASYNGGVTVLSNGELAIVGANSSEIKRGSASSKSAATARQHESVFYGLAKASGDTTQSASDNPIGTYTDEAKASIQEMLGIDTIYYELLTSIVGGVN